MATDKISTPQLASDFHQILGNGFIEMLEKASALSNVSKIILGGGVLNNETLFLKLTKELNNKNFQVYTPQNITSSDGAISLGQAFYGLIKCQE